MYHRRMFARHRSHCGRVSGIDRRAELHLQEYRFGRGKCLLYSVSVHAKSGEDKIHTSFPNSHSPKDDIKLRCMFLDHNGQVEGGVV